MQRRLVVPYIFDLELSGKCNTACSFCPRDEMKRGEDFMSDENFEFFFERLQSYVRALEHQEVLLPQERARIGMGSGVQSAIRVILCGMGESLMHKKSAEWIKRIRSDIGIRVSVVTNGLLLREKTVEALSDADITVVLVSFPGIDRETYSRVMKIDFDRVLENITKAAQILPGRIQINATIPDHSSFTEQDVVQFWGAKGIPIAGIGRCHNRGGHLTDTSLTGSFPAPSEKFCGIIARHHFIAWDGRILSCCHDLHGENVLGHIAETDFFDLAERKTEIVVRGPEYRICKNCNDPERCHAAQILTLSPDSLARRKAL